MSKLTWSFALLLASALCLAAVAALPTDIPILRPRPALGSPPNSDEATTEDLEAIVVEAASATTTIDGILVVENNENGGGSSVVKEFDPSDCFLMKERGPCRAAIDSWFFNVGTKSCENFSWSGCGGNKNRFPDQSTCENLCSRPVASSTTEATASDSASSTTSPSSSSSTTAATSATSTTAKPRLPVCPKFDGCPSNCVIIQDRSDRGCKKCLCGPATAAGGDAKQQIPSNIQVSTGNITVGSSTAAPEPVGSVSGDPSATSGEEDAPIVGSPAEVCQLPAKRGHCRAMQTRYRYDSKVKDCVQFHYGGCDANPNNFVSKDKCVEYCKGQ